MKATDLIPLPQLPKSGRERGTYEVFYVSLVLKGLNAILEIVLGTALLFTAKYGYVIADLVQNELIEDPGDFFVRHANQLITYLDPRAQLIGALYLLSHGIVKGFLVWALLKNKEWAYPAALGVFALFITYEAISWFRSHSPLLLLLMVFDLLVISLIMHEYRVRLKKS